MKDVHKVAPVVIAVIFFALFGVCVFLEAPKELLKSNYHSVLAILLFGGVTASISQIFWTTPAEQKAKLVLCLFAIVTFLGGGYYSMIKTASAQVSALIYPVSIGIVGIAYLSLLHRKKE